MAIATNQNPHIRVPTLSARVLTFLASAYRGERHAAKRLARAADVSDRTAESWLCGRNMPAAEPLLRLLVTHPDLQQQINEDIALLRRAGAAASRARMRLHEMENLRTPPTGAGHGPAMDRGRSAVGLCHD